MDRRITPDDVDAHSPSQAEHLHLPHQSIPNVDTHSPSQAGHSRLPRQITPDDVDTRWPFRAGYPRLLRPSVVSIPIKEEAEKPISDADLDRLQARIAEILDSYDLPWCISPTPLPEVVYRRQKFGTSGLPRVLIHCDYDKDTSYSKKWTKAVVEIYAETQSVVKGDREVGVEMVDTASMNSQICTLPTAMSQELSANWEIGHNYCEQILHLFEAPHEMFQAMLPIGRCTIKNTGAFNDGEPTYDGTAVIFFDALNAEDILWDILEERIRAILPSHIGIEIRQRSGPLFSSPPSFLDRNVEGLIPSPEEFSRPPRLGCDIAAKGSGSAGTMGGYVVTKDENGKRTTYGVTNAHVALQSKDSVIAKVYMTSTDPNIRLRKVCIQCTRRLRHQNGITKRNISRKS
jgi:hypothetical protein